ncbi:MAG: TonB-dependent receptor [Hydrogenovibrio sp.]
MKPTPLYFAILSALSSSAFIPTAMAAETAKLEKITVEAQDDITPQSDTVSTESLLNTGNSETGAVLREINGVNASRKGGHGLDPQIRGQQYSQLNVLLDGAKIAGGCPNRMDPPSSYAEVSSYDEIEVIRGVKTVTQGAGGSGGTILFKRSKPQYDPNKLVSGEITVGKSNVMNYEADATVRAVGQKGYVILQGSRKDANNYTDGNGDVVRSSYNTNQGHVDLGWTPNEHHHLKFSAEKSRTEDALYPGAGMDAPETEADMLRLQYEGRQLSKAVTDVDIDLFRSTVDHRMNNYDLRPLMDPAKKMENPTSTATNGAKIKLTSHLGNTQVDYGVQYESVNKDATLWNRAPNPDKSMFYMWPDVTNTTKSVFAETNTEFTPSTNLIVGLRYDDVYAKAADANDTPMSGNTPTKAYANTYDDYDGETSASEGNFNGLIRLENQFGAGYNWYLGASRTMRTADATERFMARQNSWVGNPNLKPEEHNQIDLGIGQQTNSLQWNVSVWYDRVNNYILRDSASNQTDNGVIAGAKGDVYVNVDADLYGADLEADYAATNALTFGGQFSITEGRNTTDNRNIAMISAPTGQLRATYQPSNWHLGGHFNFALEQTKIDKDYELAEQHGDTPAWSTVDVFGGYQINRNWIVKAGVDNLFDQAYYDHLNYDITEGSSVYKYNEPGRNFWAKVTAKF